MVSYDIDENFFDMPKESKEKIYRETNDELQGLILEFINQKKIGIWIQMKQLNLKL